MICTIHRTISAIAFTLLVQQIHGQKVVCVFFLRILQYGQTDVAFDGIILVVQDRLLKQGLYTEYEGVSIWKIRKELGRESVPPVCASALASPRLSPEFICNIDLVAYLHLQLNIWLSSCLFDYLVSQVIESLM